MTPFRPRSRSSEPSQVAAGAMVCTVDHVATAAGIAMLQRGGSAADAAVAASAVLAVTTQHMCGMGGDLWALVHDGDGDADGGPATLNASGRAGSGADPDALRAEGHTTMPYRGDVRSVPVPGCVDGWLDLLERFGRLDPVEVFGPAIDAAESGFAATHHLAAALERIVDVNGNQDYFIHGRAADTGDVIRRPGIARSLRAIAEEGRAAWYEDEFGQGLIELGRGLFTTDDLARSQADWVEPVTVRCWGHDLHTAPPNSQGYLSLAGAVLAAGLDLPDDPGDPLWAHLLIESAKQAARDRPTVLHENADGSALVSEQRMAERRALIDPDRAVAIGSPTAGGGTIHLTVVDRNRMGVSLIQSNAAGFGAHLTVPGVGVFLHNRGIGFSLEPGHPAELGPGRRPPSTLSPALVTLPDGSLRAVLGTMGGDGQPQVVLQMLAGMLAAGDDPGTVVSRPRFTLTVPDAGGFDTWSKADRLTVAVESGSGWIDGLVARGHRVEERPWGQGLFGHAHLIENRGDHLAGATEPRVGSGAAVGL